MVVGEINRQNDDGDFGKDDDATRRSGWRRCREKHVFTRARRDVSPQHAEEFSENVQRDQKYEHGEIAQKEEEEQEEERFWWFQEEGEASIFTKHANVRERCKIGVRESERSVIHGGRGVRYGRL